MSLSPRDFPREQLILKELKLNKSFFRNCTLYLTTCAVKLLCTFPGFAHFHLAGLKITLNMSAQINVGKREIQCLLPFYVLSVWAEQRRSHLSTNSIPGIKIYFDFFLFFINWLFGNEIKISVYREQHYFCLGYFLYQFEFLKCHRN